jgi:hypothetical protein
MVFTIVQFQVLNLQNIFCLHTSQSSHKGWVLPTSLGTSESDLLCNISLQLSKPFADARCCHLLATSWKIVYTGAQSWTRASTRPSGATVCPIVRLATMKPLSTAPSSCSFLCFTSPWGQRASWSSVAPFASLAAAPADVGGGRNFTVVSRACPQTRRQSARKLYADTATILCATWRSTAWPLCDKDAVTPALGFATQSFAAWPPRIESF